MALTNQRVLVLGLGDTGLSALRWLRSQGALLSVADSRESPPNLAAVRAEFQGIQIHTGAFRQSIFDEIDLVVISPGVALAEPEVQGAIRRGIPVVGDVELFARYKSPAARVIAITGSNGKTTVTTLVGEMCKEAGLSTIVAGNIGLPVLDALAMPVPDVYVLELSSFQLETTSALDADVATVLNVTEDHMDRYAGMAEYAAAKARIFNGGGVQVLNRQDDWSMGMALPGREIVTFGMDAPEATAAYGLRSRSGSTWLAQGAQMLMDTGELRIAGLHNAANALAAIALCQAIGIDLAPLLQTLRRFKGLPHRVEWVAEIGQVAFYDDSKGTNVGATCAAIAGLGKPAQKIVLIAGGDGKGQDFTPLRAPVLEHGRAVVLIGRDADAIATAIGAGVPTVRAHSLESAVDQAFEAAHQGDAVLLSPACASFDMFRNYVHRAEVFVGAVHALANRQVPATGRAMQ